MTRIRLWQWRRYMAAVVWQERHSFTSRCSSYRRIIAQSRLLLEARSTSEGWDFRVHVEYRSRQSDSMVTGMVVGPTANGRVSFDDGRLHCILALKPSCVLAPFVAICFRFTSFQYFSQICNPFGVQSSDWHQLNSACSRFSLLHLFCYTGVLDARVLAKISAEGWIIYGELNAQQIIRVCEW